MNVKIMIMESNGPEWGAILRGRGLGWVLVIGAHSPLMDGWALGPGWAQAIEEV